MYDSTPQLFEKLDIGHCKMTETRTFLIGTAKSFSEERELVTVTISFSFLVYIAKALELFMQSLIDEACMETRAKNAKRLTAAHL